MRFVAVRTAQAVAIVFLVATLTFVLLQLAPGDPFTGGESEGRVPADVRAQQRRNFGLDGPLAERYVRYLVNVARGDFGYSFAERRPVVAAIGERIPNTLALAGAGLVVMFGLGILIGAVQGIRPASATDDLLTGLTLTLYSVPVFWLGLMLLFVFGETLDWLPVGGAIDPARYPYLTVLGKLGDRIAHLVLPALSLGLVGAAVTARYQRTAMVDAIKQDYVRTARAKGLPERVVVYRHALRNSLLPVVTLFGLAFPILLSGAVLVETVFAWPGLGKFAVDSIYRRDYPAVTATAVVAAAMVVVGNLLADLLYRAVDPRTRTHR